MEAEFEAIQAAQKEALLESKVNKSVTSFAEQIDGKVDKQAVEDNAKYGGLSKEEYEEAEKLIDPEGALTQSLATISKKGLWRQIKKVVQECEVIVYVLDARDPEGTRCQELEELVKENGKKLIFVNNKSDLVPDENADAWKAHFKKQGFLCLNFQANKMIRSNENKEEDEDMEDSEQAKNVEKLMKALFKYYLKFAEKKDVENIGVGVVGFTNSGKSSLINVLKNKPICPSSSTPMLTKKLQEVKLSKQITLIDTPGIILSQKGETH
mmetsp:Transcript_2004/g.2985  ORF Transcript_2004/g.2985 Transcript_2004/m.2985 type:complete len:268 (-) Transcript_2004:333-1136(-)